MQTPATADRHPRDRLRRELGLGDATMIVISSVVGAGLFLTPGAVADLLPRADLFLLAWLIGGALSLAGALANAELGALLPHAGGDYVYLREAFHPLAGFVVGWLSFFAIYAGTIATLASGFAEGLTPFLALGEGGRLVVALTLVAVTSWINFVGVRAGARFNAWTTVVKIVGTAGLAIVGLAAALAARLASDPASGATPEASSVARLAPHWTTFGAALSPVLFSYLGWNASVYVASEIREPARNLPRSLFLGLGACTLLYLAVNSALVLTLPMSALAGAARPVEAAARALAGESGGLLVAALVELSVLGCLSATILVGPRIAYAMALDGMFFTGTERVHAARATPHVAIAAQALVAATLIVALRSFPRLLDYTTFAIVLATSADVAALYRLRHIAPDLPRPYRAWGHPVVPGLYLLANLAIAVAMIVERPSECLVSLAVAASALPFAVLFRARRW